MSKKLRQRGRYPKNATSAYNQPPSSATPQQQQPSNLPPNAGVPFYNVPQGQVQENHSDQYMWQHQPSSSSTFMPSENLSSVQQPNAWATYSEPHANDAWDWAPKNGTNNTHQPQLQTTQQTAFQPYDLHQQQQTEVQQHQTFQFHHVPPQDPLPTMQFQQNNFLNNQVQMQDQVQENCTASMSYMTPGSLCSTESKNEGCPQTVSHFQPNYYPSTTSMTTPEVTQPPWVHNTSQNPEPYYNNQVQTQQWAVNELSDCNADPNCVQNWNLGETGWQQQPSDAFLPNQQVACEQSNEHPIVTESTVPNANDLSYNGLTNSMVHTEQFSSMKSEIVGSETICDNGSGALSSFFNNDVQKDNNLPSYDNSLCFNVNQQSKSNDNLAAIDSNVNVPSETSNNKFIDLEVPFDMNPETNIQRNEISQLSIYPLQSPVEEPLNQEIPEQGCTTNHSTSSHPISELTPDQISSDDSLEETTNQQVPNEMIPPNSERIVSKESPERVPVKSVSDTPVQKETDLSFTPTVDNNITTSIHEVNLETVPDNLELPPEPEDKKPSMFNNPLLRQHHPLKDKVDDIKRLPSTSLFESPNLPCVTFIPATPLPVSANEPRETQPLQLQLQEDSSPILKHQSNLSRNISPVLPAQFNEQEDNEVINKLNSLNISSQDIPIEALKLPSDVQEHSKNLVSNHASSFEKLNDKSDLRLDESSILQTSSPIKTKDSTSHQSKPKSQPRQSSPPPSHGLENNRRYDPDSESNRNIRHPPSRDRRGQYDNYDHRDSAHSDHDRSRDYRVDDSRHRLSNDNYTNFEDRPYSERGSSRPSSRMSLNESSDAMSYRDNKYYSKRAMSDREQSPSRMSDSEVGRHHRDSSYRYDDRMYERRPANDERYYQQQQPYYRGYDYDYYQQQQQYYGYYDPYWSNYNSYNYGFHDELYRNDPRYRQQVEEYKEYYRRYGYETDCERLSVQSGRSSANEFAKDMQHRYAESDQNSTAHYSPDAYPDEQSQLSLDISNRETSTPITRLTPAKFTSCHPFAYIGTSQLITVIPKQGSNSLPAFVEIHDIQELMRNSDSFEELKNYQGPLIRGTTHKNDVIDFCLCKIQFYKTKQGIPDRESYVLLWELLVLLLRQNGSVVGSDIAELLLKGHEIHQSVPLKITQELLSNEINSLPEAGDGPLHISPGDTSSPDEGIVVSQDKTILNAPESLSIDILTRKFREFLLYGHKKDALEWAMKHGLWGHALFLASKMDLRTHANVMTRFANSLALNDPLQTLYQLMSGRQPAAVTCIADKQWGNWRPHLAMILSNPSYHPDVDFKSITTLGDTLASQGCLPAAHFCYLMAQVEFGSYSQKNSKIILLSADHQLPFERFSTNEAIQCTEIYEYAQALANPGFILNHLQAYKFMYATRLLDHGFVQEALHYCEVLTSNFLSNSSAFSTDLIKQVYEIASRLKYNDPHYLQGQGEIEDQEDPDWLKTLFALSNNSVQDCQQIPPNSNYEDYNNPIASYGDTYPQETTEDYSRDRYNSDAQSQNFYSPQTEQQTYFQNTSQGFPSTNDTVPQKSEQSYVADGQVSTPLASPYLNNAPLQPPPNHWNGAVQPMPESYNQVEHNEDSSIPSANTSPTSRNFGNKFDFYGSDNQQGHNVQAMNRQRTSSTSSVGFQRNRHDSTLSSGSDFGNASGNRAASDNQKTENKDNKARQQIGRSWLGGIFSKFLPKAPNQMILPDDKNPTIVWDSSKRCWTNTDSNEEGSCPQPVAPPTDVELSSKENSIDSHQPMSIPTNTVPNTMMSAAPLPGANKFKRAKVKGMRQNYVDVLNSSAGSTKPDVQSPASANLFPSMPVHSNAPNYFVPPATIDQDSPVDFVTTAPPPPFIASQVTEDTANVPRAPPMFDPAEFDSRRSSLSSTRHSVGSSRRAYPT